MKYIILCLFVIVAGFWIGRKAPLPSASHTISHEHTTQPTANTVAPHPDSHSEGVVTELRKARAHVQEMNALAEASRLSANQKQVLVAQVKNKKESVIVRRLAAFTLRRHMEENEWRVLVSQMDPRLKEAISLNSRELLESYIHASR